MDVLKKKGHRTLSNYVKSIIRKDIEKKGGIKMNGAYGASTLYYINRKNQYVCFKLDTAKKVKTKIKNFITNEHQENKIREFLKTLELKLIHFSTSNNYIHYIIVNEDISKETAIKNFLEI